MFTTYFLIALSVLVGFLVRAKLAPRTSMQELIHLLSLDEKNLLEGKLQSGPEGSGEALLDLTVYGDHLQCRYISGYSGNTYIENVWIVVLTTKASLYAQFENEALCRFEFTDNPFDKSGRSFSGKLCLSKMGPERFLAGHALAVAEHKAEKELQKLRGVQLV